MSNRFKFQDGRRELLKGSRKKDRIDQLCRSATKGQDSRGSLIRGLLADGTPLKRIIKKMCLKVFPKKSWNVKQKLRRSVSMG